MGDRSRSLLGCTQIKIKVCKKDYNWYVRLVYDLSELSGVTIVSLRVIGVLQLQDYGFICLCLQDLCTASLDSVVVLGTTLKKLMGLFASACKIFALLA
jgi:hypothetical protein